MIIHAFLTWLSGATWQTTASDHHAPETGQGLVEYALIIILVGVVVIAMLFALGPAIGNMYQNILEVVTR